MIPNSHEWNFAVRWREVLVRIELDPVPKLEHELKFHPDRNWRFDFGCRAALLAIEIDGGMHQGARGGHTSFAGATRDRQKDFAAIMLGWTVIRLTPLMITWESVEQIARLASQRMATEKGRQDGSQETDSDGAQSD